jgi:hypothetical protein
MSLNRIHYNEVGKFTNEITFLNKLWSIISVLFEWFSIKMYTFRELLIRGIEWLDKFKASWELCIRNI